MHPADEAALLDQYISELTGDDYDVVEMRTNMRERVKMIREILASNHRDRVGLNHWAMVTYDGEEQRVIIREIPNVEILTAFGTVAIDTETTGLVHGKDGPYDVSGVCGDRQLVIHHNPTWATMNPSATAVNGVSQDDLEQMSAWSRRSVEAIQSFIGGHTIVGHNVGYDIGMINAVAKRVIGRSIIDVERVPVIDTQVVYKILHPREEKVGLDKCLEKYGMSRTGRYHGALEDAVLTGDLLTKMIW